MPIKSTFDFNAPAFLEEVKEKYTRGLGLEEIAKQYGVSKEPIRKRLISMGVKLRKNTCPSKLTDAQGKEILSRYAEGESSKELAVAFNIGTATVIRYIHKYGGNAEHCKSDQISDQIIQDYHAGLNYNQLASKYKLSRDQIRYCLVKNNIPLVYKKPNKLSNEQAHSVVLRYSAGESAPLISKDFSINPTSVTRYVRLAGVPVRDSSESKARLYTVNEHAFDTLTDEAAYWAGMLITDGCITNSKRRQPALCLELQSNDRAHLSKFLTFLGSNQPVRDYTRNKRGKQLFSSVMSIHSRILAQKLTEYGIVPRKTFKAYAVSVLETNVHFWRGCIDGDGSLHIKSSSKNSQCVPVIYLCGTKQLVTQFLSFISQQISTTVSITTDKNIWRITFTGKVAEKVISLLYTAAPISLDRKQHRANRILEIAANGSKQSDYAKAYEEFKTCLPLPLPL